MNDLIFAAIIILFFIVSALYVRFCDNLQERHLETIVISVIALLLFIYLFVAMICPEKF